MKIDGIPVRDARRRLTFTVNENDRRRSNPKKNDSCAGALGICRSSGARRAQVNLGRTLVLHQSGKYWERYQTPMSLRTQVVAFDATESKKHFQLGDYTLVPFCPAKKLGAQRGSSVGQHLKTRKRARAHFIEGVRERASLK